MLLQEDLENTQLCRGSLYRATGRAEVAPLGRLLKLAVQYQHELVDDLRYQAGTEDLPDGRFRQDLAGFFEVTSQPLPQLRLRARTKYLVEDPSDDAYGERSSWTTAEVGWMPSKVFAARLRYDLLAYLDQRPSTLSRQPNPEHRFWLRLESRF